MPTMGAPDDGPAASTVTGNGAKPDFRWLMSSDVCKHCTHAACLDVCPTGSLFRTEFGTVVVQDDICNGCGYCVPACPYGVIDRRDGPEGAKNVGIAQKCTLCYDRLDAGKTPACAQACPTQSIQFGDVDELRARAQQRVDALHTGGVTEARLYGHDPDDGVGGAGAFMLLLDEPEAYGLPPDPVVTTRDLPDMYKKAVAAAGALLAGAVLSFVGRRG
jgi:formate dehydrogenase iron-sulfur subunit